MDSTLAGLAAALAALPLAQAIRTSAWAYPMLETGHIIGLATLLGTMLLVELQVLGASRARDRLAYAQLAAHALPWTLAGFGLAIITGALMFVSRAEELVWNRAFLTKMPLIACAGLNALWFTLRRSGHRGDTVAKLQAGASILIWLGVITCGRLIAYV